MIPDNDAVGIGDTVNIATVGAITDLDVVINSTHTYVGDLIFTLSHESGASVVLIDRPGDPAVAFGCGGDDVSVTMNDEGTEPVSKPSLKMSGGIIMVSSSMADWRIRIGSSRVSGRVDRMTGIIHRFQGFLRGRPEHLCRLV